MARTGEAVAATGFWRRYLLPDARTALAIARHRVARQRLRASGALSRNSSGATHGATPSPRWPDESLLLDAPRVHALLELLLSFGAGEGHAHDYLASLRRLAQDEQDRLTAEVEAERLDLLRLREGAADRLRSLTARLVSHVQQKLGPLAQAAKASEQALRRELGRHGFSPD